VKSKKEIVVVEEPVVEEIIEEEPAPKQEVAEEEDPSLLIENIKAEKIEGPKILGKIDLPVDSDTRPKPAEEKRKRKRIPIEKKSSGTIQTDGNVQKREERPAGSGTRFPIRKDERRTGGDNRNKKPEFRPASHNREVKEIDQKEIQEKIRQTQAKLAGSGGRGKSLKAKYRRAKRDEMAENAGTEEVTDNKLQVTEFISVSELANLMDVSYADVISKCMSLGMMVSINQRLEADVIELVAGEFGYTVEFVGIDDANEMEDDDQDDVPEDLEPRSPIVTIMGHVDHGKTSLLDYIRSANVVAGEAGGITQHIGAYEVTLPEDKKIAFLDTPGHEAFTAMRARGAQVTDIAVIVIAADDAVMPQTKEAISHAQAAGVPMIFAVNKIDKDGANPQKIYEQLASMNLLVESWGGKYQSQEISAKKGLNVDQLLEKILLEAELLDLKANPNREASGTIIEATLDKGRGYVATVLVQNGTLRNGDLVVSGQHFGRIKAMFNERNKRVDIAPPSTPVLLLGLNGAPQAGEKFKVFTDESEAKEVANKRAQILREQGIRTKKHITLDEIGRRLALGNFKELNLIIKGDVDGSVEALSDSLQKLSTEEIAVRVVHKAVGAITESDILLATASDAVIVGFNVRPSLQASRLAENEGVEIKTYSIIYNAIEEVKSAMEGMLEPKIQEKVVANVEVRNVFKFDKATVAGCYVLDGKIYRNSKIRLVRDGIVIYPTGEGATAELASLKRFKDDVKEVASSMECGLTIKNYNDIKVGDIVEAYEEEEVKRTL
jgi:translation initiation factor IF-2